MSAVSTNADSHTILANTVYVTCFLSFLSIWLFCD